MFNTLFFIMMTFLISFNDVKPILYTFLGTIGLLVVFMGVAYLSKYISDKIKNKKTDLNKVKSEIYRLVYENKNMNNETLISFLDIDPKIAQSAIDELIRDNVIEMVDKAYVIKTKKEDSSKDNDK